MLINAIQLPNFNGEFWGEQGFEVDITEALMAKFVEPIRSRDQAAKIAVEILESRQDKGSIENFELMQAEYNSNQDIWVFGYWINDMWTDSSSFHVAVNGESSEIIRMWSI